MGTAQVKGVAYNDPRFDRSLTTKGDITAMELNVQGWCDQVRADVRSITSTAATETETQVKRVEAAFRDAVQSITAAVDAYRQDDLRYRNNRTVRGRLRRLKWWLVAILPFGIGACIGGEAVPHSDLTVHVDSARHVACYQLYKSASHLSCVRIDSLTVWRANDSTWILR